MRSNPAVAVQSDVTHPRDGSLILSDVCSPSCARRAGGNGATMWSGSWRSAKLTDLLQTLADCPRRARSASTTAARRAIRFEMRSVARFVWLSVKAIIAFDALPPALLPVARSNLNDEDALLPAVR
jgi:hypothetical protein